jgi:AbrB family looped-hinge helix DNA binding protein
LARSCDNVLKVHLRAFSSDGWIDAMAVQVSITAKGRMSLPADIRKRLGLAGGGALLVEETEGGVILRTVAQSISYAQAIAKKYAGDNPAASVDAFLTRRCE